MTIIFVLFCSNCTSIPHDKRDNAFPCFVRTLLRLLKETMDMWYLSFTMDYRQDWGAVIIHLRPHMQVFPRCSYYTDVPRKWEQEHISLI